MQAKARPCAESPSKPNVRQRTEAVPSKAPPMTAYATGNDVADGDVVYDNLGYLIDGHVLTTSPASTASVGPDSKGAEIFASLEASKIVRFRSTAMEAATPSTSSTSSVDGSSSTPGVRASTELLPM